MTDTTPEVTPDEPTAAVQPVADDQPQLPAENKDSGRWAVYDTKLMRYVGDVTDKRPTKADANKLVHTPGAFAIREV